MILTSSDLIPGKEIKETLGLVKGNTIKAKHIGKDILAGLRNIIGGEIKEYTEALSEARKTSTKRMIEEAEKLGADAIVCVRFTTSQVMSGAAELLVYGTAVKLAR
ncbi:YbjQ family protein [Candidatus Falkowbacteria bacterium]|nr:MAG: YbjQ family protein [Candidatus Falkowbacteria bacterium]